MLIGVDNNSNDSTTGWTGEWNGPTTCASTMDGYYSTASDIIVFALAGIGVGDRSVAVVVEEIVPDAQVDSVWAIRPSHTLIVIGRRHVPPCSAAGGFG
jgi:hypothetical protein